MSNMVQDFDVLSPRFSVNSDCDLQLMQMHMHKAFELRGFE